MAQQEIDNKQLSAWLWPAIIETGTGTHAALISTTGLIYAICKTPSEANLARYTARLAKERMDKGNDLPYTWRLFDGGEG
jgi:hypothetical protein